MAAAASRSFIRQSTPDPQDIPPVTTAPTAPRNSPKATAPRSWSEASRNRLHQSEASEQEDDGESEGRVED